MSRTYDAVQEEIDARRRSARPAPASASAAGASARDAETRGATAEGAGSPSSALVPTGPPRSGRFGRWVRRVAELVRPAPPVLEVPPELRERMRALEVQLAAHEEQTRKRLAEGEARALHLLQERLDLLGQELTTSLRDVAAREVEERTAGLRRRLALVSVLVVAASIAAGLALARIFGVPAG